MAVWSQIAKNGLKEEEPPAEPAPKMKEEDPVEETSSIVQ